MTEKEKDILIDEITNVADQSCNDGFNYFTAEKLATELVERLVKKLNIDDVSNCLEFKENFNGSAYCKNCEQHKQDH